MSTPLTFCQNCTVVLQDPVSFVKYINDAYIFISVDVNYFSFMPFCIGWVENFDEITLSCTVKKIEANSCFSIFGKNLKIQNGRHFWGGENFLKIAKNTMLKYLWVEYFDKIALSRTVKEIEGNLYFAIFGKNSKIQNGRHFWGGENFLKIAKIAFLRYPVGRKFRRNRSISHG